MAIYIMQSEFLKLVETEWSIDELAQSECCTRVHIISQWYSCFIVSINSAKKKKTSMLPNLKKIPNAWTIKLPVWGKDE